MEDARYGHHPLSPWLADRLERTRLAPIDPEPFVTFYAGTTEESFRKWLDSHHPLWLDVAEGHRIGLYRGTWSLDRCAHADDAIGGVPQFLDPSGQWLPACESEYCQPILLFRLAPCSADRCEITLFRTPDPRVRPLIDSLLQDIARAWPETAETLAPLVPGAATGSSQPDPARVPRVPSKPGILARWRKVWEIIRRNGLDWKTAEAISRDVRLKIPGLAYSAETIEDILAAGRAGELD